MSFATRCPECRAKLRLEAAPDAGETIECPKCGSTFSPDDSADEAPPPPKKVKKPKKVKTAKKPTAPGGPKKRTVKKKKTNPVLLYGALGSALAFVVVLTIFLVYYMGKAGKVEEMLCYVPGECNIVRGVNTGQINKYPGFVNEMDPFITSQVKTMANDLAVAVGLDDGDDVMDYVIIGKYKKAAGSTGVAYVFRAKKSFPKVNPLDGAASMTAADSNGTTYYNSNGKGLMAKAAVFTPTNKLIVVIPSGPQQKAMIAAVAAGGVKNKESMFAGKAGDTGRKVSGGNNWCVIRPEGTLKSFAKDMGTSVKSAFPGFAKACENTTAIGWWTTYGGNGVNFGGAVECADSTAAYELKKSMDDSEFGKQDDAEIPNDVKKAITASSNKEFREFLAWLKFRKYGMAGYFTAKMSAGNGKNYTRILHSPSAAGWDDDSNAGSAVGGFGPPGGGRGGP